jgi:hypothetical protein
MNVAQKNALALLVLFNLLVSTQLMASIFKLTQLDTIPLIAAAGADQSFACNQMVLTLDGSNSTPNNDIFYEWEGPGILTNSDQAIIEIDAPGMYILTVMQLSSGYFNTDTVVIGQIPALHTADAGENQLLSCAVSSVTLTGSSTAASATYLWTGPDITSINKNLVAPEVSIAGTYTLVVTDLINNCKSDISYVFVSSDFITPFVEITKLNDLDCQNQTVSLLSNTDLTFSDAMYQWYFNNEKIINGTNSTVLAENEGQYTLEITNFNNGCRQTGLILLEDLSQPLPINIVGATTINCLLPELQLMETGVSNLPNVTIDWNTFNGHISQPITDQSTIRLDAPGLYVLTAQNTSNGCIDRDSVWINIDFERPVLSFNQTFSISCAIPEVDLKVDVSSNSNQLDYKWTGNNFISDESMPTVSKSGIYQVVVTQTSNGCTNLASVNVIKTEGIDDVLISVFSPKCGGAEVGLMRIDSVLGGYKPFLFSINANFTENTNFEDLQAGNYLLEIKDSLGCRFETSFTIAPKPDFDFNISQELSIALGDSIQLNPQTDALDVTYVWSDSLSLSCNDCATPWAKPLESTLYHLQAINKDGCVVHKEVKIIVTKDLKLYVPNVFSPESTEGNLHYMIFTGSQVTMIKEFKVFNRWGELIYNKENLLPNDELSGWDGYCKDKKAKPNVYVFYAKLLIADHTMEEITGDFLLVW